MMRSARTEESRTSSSCPSVAAGTSVGKTLHRIEEATLKSEVEAAGFKLVGEGDFFRHSEDPRDERVFGSKVPVDEFVLKFQK